jgi:PAS domain S-box-containing protein
MKDKDENIDCVVCTARDITDRKRAEEQLLNAAQQWRTTFDGISDMVCLLDPEGKILRCNNAMANLLKKPFREIIGRLHWEIVYGTTAPIQECPVMRMRETHRRQTAILPINDRWFNIAVDPLLDETSSLIGAVHIMSDITERKRAEEEMAVLQEQLRQSQKMEAIGQLAGGVAHDFNNLLTIIKGYTQLFLMELKEGDPLKNNVEEIQKAADRATDLTRQLLVFSRRQIMEMKVLNLNFILKSVDKMLRRVIGEDIELVILLADDLGKVKTDSGWMEQVIVNLMINAKDAMPSGGKITIETANVEIDEAYAHKHITVIPGRYVMFSVSDTGVGMTPEVKDRVFEPFFTTKERDKGTGLGLSTVYGIVKQSGGDVWVYSEPGHGTTFKIYLPQVDDPLDEMGAKGVEKVNLHGDETILVVEDEGVVRKLVVRIFRELGYRVLETDQGAEAFCFCGEHKGPIHLLLTDVVMPG